MTFLPIRLSTVLCIGAVEMLKCLVSTGIEHMILGTTRFEISVVCRDVATCLCRSTCLLRLGRLRLGAAIGGILLGMGFWGVGSIVWRWRFMFDLRRRGLLWVYC